MMDREILLEKLSKVEKYANTSKLRRFRHNPFKYIFAIVYRHIIYPLTNHSFDMTVNTFWGERLTIDFPSSIDIYLSGGKTHNSETRLAKYLVKHLKIEDYFLDIGAHIGFFSKLVAQILPIENVFSVEPSKKSFELLCQNVYNQTKQLAISDENGEIDFMELPSLYSEYNSIDSAQYSSQPWFKSSKTNRIEMKKGDNLIQEIGMPFTIIKIDVEGSEDKVIQGMSNYLTQSSPTIIMEILTDTAKNVPHLRANTDLQTIGYQSFRICSKGNLKSIDCEFYLKSLKLESDNIIYQKRINDKI